MLQAILKSKFRATGSGNRRKRWMRVAGMIASKEKLRRTSCNGNVPVNTTVSARHIQRPSHPCSKPLLAVLFLRQGAFLYQSHPSLRPTLRHKSGRRSKRMTHADTRLLQRLRQGAFLCQSHPSLRPTLRHKSGRRSKRMTHADTRLLQRLGPSVCPCESPVLRAVLRRVRVVIAHAQPGVPPASVRSLCTHNAMSACTCSHRLLRTLGSERFSYGPGVRKERS